MLTACISFLCDFLNRFMLRLMFLMLFVTPGRPGPVENIYLIAAFEGTPPGAKPIWVVLPVVPTVP